MLRSIVKLRLPSCLLVFIAVSILNAEVSAAVQPARVAIIPLADNSGSIQGLSSIDLLLEAQFKANGLAVVPPESLRTIMRRGRIRMNGMIDSRYVETLQRELAIQFIVTGSLDFYNSVEDPEVGLSIRLYDCNSKEVVWGASQSATGESFAKVFELGRVDSVQAVASLVVRALFKNFPQKLTRMAGDSQEVIAIIPFDNESETQNAGEIANNLLISVLMDHHLRVIEPGEINRVCSENRTVLRGETEVGIAKTLRDSLGVTTIVTGTIYKFTPGRGIHGESTPQFEAGLRMIDAATGKLLAAVSVGGEGEETETVFGKGKESRLGNLASKYLEKGWSMLNRQKTKRSAVTAQK